MGYSMYCGYHCLNTYEIVDYELKEMTPGPIIPGAIDHWATPRNKILKYHIKHKNVWKKQQDASTTDGTMMLQCRQMALM